MRRWLAIAAVAAALTVAVPGAAHAYGGYASGPTSPEGGYGVAVWYNDSSSERVLEACDYGEPDGRRAVAKLLSAGVLHTTHAAGGAGTCNARSISGLRAGASYELWVCLRNGASGSDVYCSGHAKGYID